MKPAKRSRKPGDAGMAGVIDTNKHGRRGVGKEVARRTGLSGDFRKAIGFLDVVSKRGVGKFYTLRQPKLYPIEIIYFILSA